MNETIFDRDPVAAKALAFSEVIINTAMLTLRHMRAAYPPKRTFRKIDRRPLKRMNKQRARLQMLMALPMGAMQVAMIASQPVRKFPSGAPGIVGERGAEIIIIKP